MYIFLVSDLGHVSYLLEVFKNTIKVALFDTCAFWQNHRQNLSSQINVLTQYMPKLKYNSQISIDSDIHDENFLKGKKSSIFFIKHPNNPILGNKY